MKKRLLFYFLFSILLTAVTLSAIVLFYLNHKMNKLSEDYKKDLIHQVIQKITAYHKNLYFIEEKLNIFGSEKTLEVIKDLKRKSTHQLKLEELKKIALNHEVDEISVVDREGRILQSSYVFNINQNEKIHEKIGKGKVFYDRITLSAASGYRVKYFYFSPEKSDFFIVIGIYLRNYFEKNYNEEYYRFIFQEIFSSMVNENKDLKTLDFYVKKGNDYWSLLYEGKKITYSLDFLKKLDEKKEIFIKENGKILFFTSLQLEDKSYFGSENILLELKIDFSLSKKLLNNILFHAVLGCAFVVILIFILFSKILDQKIVQRIENMNKNVKEIGKGNYQIHFFDEGKDELGEISFNLNEMLKSIELREKELNLAKDNLEEALKIKSQFLSNMNHELRTPLTAVIGMIQLFSMTELNEEQKEYLEIIQLSSEALIKVVKDILDFSEIKSGKIEIIEKEFDPYKTFEKLFHSYAEKAKQKKIHAEFQISENFPAVIKTDSYHLKQIAIHLLDNAVKFTSNGNIVFRLEELERENHKSRIRMIVKDTGIGIPEKYIPVIFDSFNQIDYSDTRNYGGTGLGLAIVKALVNLLGGKIEVYSTIEKGTEVFIEIEVEVIQDFSYKERFAKKYPLSYHPSILIVEDNPINQEVFKKIIEEKKWKWKLAENGERAVEMVQEESFELIIMDIQMPGMDGFEASDKIRKIEKSKEHYSYIIAVTAFELKGYAELCKLKGLDGYLSKPIHIQDFYHLVESLLFENEK
ncbi:MAG TPA: hypothetical protein DHW82_04395 [Spirochaetia bacterium]|nr:hypothetical protein [Spirochaetia bacterium]